MLYHVLDGLAGRAEVLPWVKVVWVKSQVLAYCGCHCQAKVGVDVDLADTGLACTAKHFFWYALGSVDFSAELVALGDEFRKDCGGSVEYEGEVRQQTGDRIETIKVELRISFEFVSSVAGTDRDGEGINASTFYELDCLIWVGVGSVPGRYVDCVLDTGKASELSFNDYSTLVGIVYDFFDEFDVFFEWVVGCVDHD